MSTLLRPAAAGTTTAASAIRETIARIKFNTAQRTQMNWQELYSTIPQEQQLKQAGFFMAKVDVSEVPMDKLQASLRVFERQLLAHGYGLYSINYMQDFSGVLDWETLVDYLWESAGFREEGDASAMCQDTPTILANTDSVGKHICTWMHTREAGYMVCT
ncbi:MAG: hypothetical protein AB2556_25875 [Candidatus Thiodiazotropha sp.]